MTSLFFGASRRFRLPLGRRAVLERLGSLVGTSGQLFHGRVDGSEFVIERINRYRSTHLPRLEGTVLDRGRDSEVRLRLRPHLQVLIFYALWFAFLLIAALLILLLAEGGRLLLLAAPLGLGGSTWMLGSLVFESDCTWSVRALEEALESGKE